MPSRRSNRERRSAAGTTGGATLALVAAAGLAVACGGAGDGLSVTDWRAEASPRLIEEAPTVTFEPEQVYDEAVVFELDLDREPPPAGWRRSDAAALADAGPGLPIPSALEGAWLLASVERISECDLLVVDATWARSASLGLAVTPAGSPPAPGAELAEPMVAVGRDLFLERAATGFRFELPPSVRGGPPGAARTIALQQVDGDPVSAVRLRCIRQRRDLQALATALSRQWKVDLGGEVRFAVAALPAQPVAFRAAIPERAVLRFGYGAAPEHESPVGVEIAARATGAPDGEVLFRAEPIARGAWLDAEVDLAPYAGRELTLELRAVSAEGWSGEDTLAFFAHPALVRLETAGRVHPPNVLLISIDTLRADHLELYGYERRTAPNLTAWAEREAVVFERVVAQAPWTLPSHVSMLTGLDALAHGVNYHRPAPEGLVLLPEILLAQGYRTLAVTGGAYLDPQFGLGQGFERYRYHRGQGYEHEMEEGLEVALAWLRDAADEPFFLFFHTYNVHEPYFAREPYYSAFADGREPAPAVVTRALPPRRELAFQARREMVFRRDRDGAKPDPHVVRAMYDSGIAHTDRGVQRLLGALDELGIADRTIVVFTSDHGEALGEHGLAGHGDLYDHTVLVPLIVKLPEGEGAGARIGRQVRSMDIAPTLLDLLRLPAPAPLTGLSLLPMIRGSRPPDGDAVSYEAIGNRGLAIRSGDGHKYVLVDAAWKPTAVPTESLFDLRADPAELRASTDESPAMRRLRRRAQRQLHRSATGLHVRIRNAGDDPLCGVLRSGLLRHNSLKVPAAQSFVDWMGAGKVRLRLPAREETSLILLDVASAAPTLSFEAGGCGPSYPPGHRHVGFEPLIVERPLAELTSPRWHRLDAGHWRPASGGGTTGADAVLSVAWVGALFSIGERADVPAGGELEQRLRALGYL